MGRQVSRLFKRAQGSWHYGEVLQTSTAILCPVRMTAADVVPLMP